jgi:16S rRNA (cytosine967-C5)-methyltransferase
LDVLLSVGRGGPTLAQRLAQPDVEALPPRDRALLHELVLGTLRGQGALDHALAACLDHPPGRMDPRLRAVLRMGAHQLLRLRVPARAAVNESVELTRGFAPWATGLVNAVLRRLAREGPPPFPDPVKQPLAWLTTEGSLPAWLAERWIGRLGEESAILRARAFLDTPPLAFRVNPRRPEAWEKIEAAGIEPQPLPVPGAWRAGRGGPQALAREGLLYVQDQGAQLAAHLAAVPGMLLDACAAPGGKATLLADLVGDDGRVVAAESSLARLESLARLGAVWGCRNLWCVAADAQRPPFGEAFHALLLDAPCSGLGTLARHPDIRWRTQPGDLVRHSGRQRALMASLAPLVKKGGRLVYATCSAEPEENEEVVGPFLADHPRFALAPLPDWAQVFADGAFARTAPENHGGDAFFCAVLVRG